MRSFIILALFLFPYVAEAQIPRKISNPWHYEVIPELIQEEEPEEISTGGLFVLSWVGAFGGYGAGVILAIAGTINSEVGFMAPSIFTVGIVGIAGNIHPARAITGTLLGSGVGYLIVLGEPTSNFFLNLSLGAAAHAGIMTLVSKIHFRLKERP